MKRNRIIALLVSTVLMMAGSGTLVFAQKGFITAPESLELKDDNDNVI